MIPHFGFVQRKVMGKGEKMWAGDFVNAVVLIIV
jgi:hypothetical protein